MNRRRFVLAGTTLGLTFASRLGWSAAAADSVRRRFSVDLSPGNIGVSGDLTEWIALAKKHGFETIQPDAGPWLGKDPGVIREASEALRAAGLRWGAAALETEFRRSDEEFRRGLALLPRTAAALRDAGVKRMGTWISPGHRQLPYAENLELHARRLREISGILRDHGLRFGLEYVGTPSLSVHYAQPFVRNLAQVRDLIARIDVPGTGVVLDSWHWWTAGDTREALLALRNEDVVAVDLNDAPAGIPLAQQQDNQRELPAATGVIPVKTFVEALLRIDYDGPVRAEPFNRPLNQLGNDEACERTAAAIRKAFALAGV